MIRKEVQAGWEWWLNQDNLFEGVTEMEHGGQICRLSLSLHALFKLSFPGKRMVNVDTQL